mmetsp:Transcript_29290/g.33635  ORF Transcript_29290/g.33635 Transcript_29290/m.33635 type:complete len:247 (+) Transcript_29290:97-837(+)
MKLLQRTSIILTLAGSTNGFMAPLTSSFQRNTVISHAANILEGKEIQNEFQPINNMLLVKRVEVIDKTEGGIFLTGKDKIKRSEGQVVSTGEGRVNSETGFHSPMPVSVGDAVFFGKFDGEELKYNGVTHTVIRDDDVLLKYPSGSDLTLENAEVIWDNVLVKVVKEDQKESGGILISETLKKSTISSIGNVMKVGPGRYSFNGELMEMDVSPGDMVKFRDYAAQEVEIGTEKYAVVKMNDLLAKF